MELRIAPYTITSESIQILKVALSDIGVKLIRRSNSRYIPKRSHIILNWGCSWLSAGITSDNVHSIINKPLAVESAINKLSTYSILKEFCIPTVKWTTSRAKVEEWLSNDCIVLGRKTATGRQGKGIDVIQSQEQFENTRNEYMYFVKHARHKREYRFHVWRNDVIDMTQTLRRNGTVLTPETQFIRSWDNGHVFCRNNITPPRNNSYDLAVYAVKCLGLDFGVVEVLEKDNPRQSIVCEVNSAPSVFGGSTGPYCQKIRAELENLA